MHVDKMVKGQSALHRLFFFCGSGTGVAAFSGPSPGGSPRSPLGCLPRWLRMIETGYVPVGRPFSTAFGIQGVTQQPGMGEILSTGLDETGHFTVFQRSWGVCTALSQQVVSVGSSPAFSAYPPPHLPTPPIT